MILRGKAQRSDLRFDGIKKSPHICTCGRTFKTRQNETGDVEPFLPARFELLFFLTEL